MKNKNEIDYNAKPALYVICMEKLRKIAASCGYALAVHGSCVHDFDLIAVRWADVYESPRYLVRELIKELSHYAFCENLDVNEIATPVYRYANQIHYTIPVYADCYIDMTVIQDK